MELAECVRALERRQNFVYQWNFVRGLKRACAGRQPRIPGGFRSSRLAQVRTVREFDEVFTAPHFGFHERDRLLLSRQRHARRRSHPRAGARSSRLRTIRSCRPRSFATRRSRRIRTSGSIVTRHGGHCGFVADRRDGHDGYWAETQIVDFARAVTADMAPSAIR